MYMNMWKFNFFFIKTAFFEYFFRFFTWTHIIF
ncbi:hypothetical protein J714_4100, partial [Acinetobacter baumannii 756476]